MVFRVPADRIPVGPGTASVGDQRLWHAGGANSSSCAVRSYPISSACGR